MAKVIEMKGGWKSAADSNLQANRPGPRVERGFHSACADLDPQRRFVVYPGTERFPVDDITDAIGVVALAKALQSPESQQAEFLFRHLKQSFTKCKGL